MYPHDTSLFLHPLGRDLKVRGEVKCQYTDVHDSVECHSWRIWSIGSLAGPMRHIHLIPNYLISTPAGQRLWFPSAT